MIKYFFLLTTIIVFTQEKPVAVIKRQYAFQKYENDYNFNVMMKTVFESANFEVFFDNEKLPEQYDLCNIYQVELEEKSSMFKTAITTTLRNCKKNVVFKTREIESREKEYQKAYIEIIKLSQPEIVRFKSILVSNSNLTQEKTEKKFLENTSNIQSSKYKWSETITGYLLLDQNLQKVFQLHKTSKEGIFIAQKGQLNGVLFNKNGKWVFEYYENNELKSEILE